MKLLCSLGSQLSKAEEEIESLCKENHELRQDNLLFELSWLGALEDRCRSQLLMDQHQNGPTVHLHLTG